MSFLNPMNEARKAQREWEKKGLEMRLRWLGEFQEALIDRRNELTDVLSKENGKPPFEALANEVLPTIQLANFYGKQAPRVLRPKNIPMTLTYHRKSTLEPWPLGVVLVISPWNYPLLLPAGEIMMGLLCGNAVLFKPSEVTPRIARLFHEVAHSVPGLPKGVFQLFEGDGSVGASLIDAKPDKIFFTGSVATGKKIMAQASQSLTPVNLELGGKDPILVLEDADLDLATSAALWGAFSNSGQICASIERAIVHESVVEEFTKKLVEKSLKLRASSTPDDESDLGRITFPKQKETYERHLSDARARGLKIVSGGELSSDGLRLAPTVVSGEHVEKSLIYCEETFGPTLAVTTFQSDEEAIEKANNSPYGLLASVFSRDLKRARRIARELQCGSVLVNEVLYTAGLPETPWGGVKETGFGKKHTAEGLLEFVHLRHIHEPRFSWLQFKSLWWFPYSRTQREVFSTLTEVYRKNVWVRSRALFQLILKGARWWIHEKRI
jgi:acyl-CoA reductase-like NAD-dependent aldehyde dehydrogenase